MHVLPIIIVNMTCLRGVVICLAGLSLLVLAVSTGTHYWEQFKVSKATTSASSVLNLSIPPIRSPVGLQNYKSSGRLSGKLQGLQPSGQPIPALPWNPSQVDPSKTLTKLGLHLPFTEFHGGPFWGCYKLIGKKDFKCVFVKKAKGE